MDFIDSLNSVIPLALKPDRPASQYILSYDEVVCQHATKQLENQKNRQQLIQIDKLSEALRLKDRERAEQETQHLEREFLLQIQIQRLRRILCEWDAQRRKYQDDIRTKEHIYQTKLEEVKHALTTKFTQDVDTIRAQNKKDLQKIKELYDIRVAKLHEHTYKQEHRVKVLEMEAGNKHNRLQISEGERQKLQANLMLKEDRIKQMQSMISQLQSQKRKLSEENQRLYEQKNLELHYLKEKNEEKLSENEQMKGLIVELQQTLSEMRVDKEQYNEVKRKMGDKIYSLQIKCQSLEQQVEQFRIRKTLHNGFKQKQASLHTISHNQSDRQLLSNMAAKDTLARLKRPFGDTMGIANSEEQQSLRKQLMKKREIQQQFAQKEQQCRQLIMVQEEMMRNLEDKEQEISKLNLAISDLQSKLAQREERIGKLQSEVQRANQMNDGGKMQKVWIERIQKGEQALQRLSKQWMGRQRELTALFRKIESTYKNQLQKSKQDYERIKKENNSNIQALMQKVKQFSTK